MGKRLGLCCAVAVAMILVPVPVTAKAERNPVMERQAYCNVYVKKDKDTGHMIDEEGSRCNNSLIGKSHAECCTGVPVPERRYSDRSVQSYTRKVYLDSYCCTSCGYVFSEEELEKLQLLEMEKGAEEQGKEG